MYGLFFNSQFPNVRVMPASNIIFLQVLRDLGLSDLSEFGGLSPSSSLSSLGLSSLLALRISTKCARRGVQISIRGLLAPNATVSTAAQSKGPNWTKVLPNTVDDNVLNMIAWIQSISNLNGMLWTILVTSSI